MQLWRVAFALQAITFLPLSLLIVNPEWIANYSDWIFPDDSQGRVFGVMSLFVTFTSGVAAFETIYPRVEVIVHACMGTFAFGATVLIFDVRTQARSCWTTAQLGDYWLTKAR